MRLPIVVLLPLLLTACTVEPVTRKIELTPKMALPTSLVELRSDGTLRIELGPIEPLHQDYAYVAWASAGADPVFLGAITAATPFEKPVTAFGVDAADIEQVQISIEEKGALPLVEPSGPHVLEANVSSSLPTTLVIPGLTDKTLSVAIATALLEDSHVQVSAMGLPILPCALFYGVSIELGQQPGVNDPRASLPIFLGRLNPSGVLSAEVGVFAANARSMSICVEADDGADAASPTCVLRANVVVPSGASTTTGSEHVH